MDKILLEVETERNRRGIVSDYSLLGKPLKVNHDQFNLWFYFASLTLLLMKITEVTQLGWQAPFAPLIFLGLVKFFNQK